MEPTPRHQCLIYDGPPADHVQALAAIAAPKIQANIRCLYLHNPSMVRSMESALQAQGIDVSREIDRGSLVLSSDQGHLVDGAFDVDRMLDMLTGEVGKSSADGFGGLWASGDMLWEFGDEKNFSKLLE